MFYLHKHGNRVKVQHCGQTNPSTTSVNYCMEGNFRGVPIFVVDLAVMKISHLHVRKINAYGNSLRVPLDGRS